MPPPRLHRGAQRVEHVHRVVPVDAGVGDALAVVQLRRVVLARGELLRAAVQVALHHHPKHAAGARCDLRGDVTRHFHLLFMLLAAVLPAAHPLFEGSLTVPYLSQGAEIIRQFIRNVSVRDDLKPRPPEEIKDEQKQEQKNPGKEQLPVDGEKVKPVTIPDETEPQPMPVQQEEINDERSEETGTAPR